MEEKRTGIKCDCGTEFIFDGDGVLCRTCGTKMTMEEFEKYKKSLK
ncbi:hypothetical protein [Methanobacterium spitsbergense]|uniref:Uncharacterized protein n=1 Tax=Methanobacterium spitsbergense TaxID=2874285 RepID=A0A8T5V0L4_9EURY|nr:hypothetical protein [Methanobacterium spitsbergense]MBZ2166990.1 hypothetical protein [Methanobacterium spitsbergense]